MSHPSLCVQPEPSRGLHSIFLPPPAGLLSHHSTLRPLAPSHPVNPSLPELPESSAHISQYSFFHLLFYLMRKRSSAPPPLHRRHGALSLAGGRVAQGSEHGRRTVTVLTPVSELPLTNPLPRISHLGNPSLSCLIWNQGDPPTSGGHVAL